MRFPAFFCIFRFVANFLSVLGFEVRARCEWLRVEALKRRRGFTRGSPQNDLLREKHREETPMATVTFTVRYLDYLKPQSKRYEVFDALVPGLATRSLIPCVIDASTPLQQHDHQQ